MNRTQFKNQPVSVVPSPVPRETGVNETASSESQVLDLIYSTDPETGLPRNDLQVYLSDQTSPVVKDYITQVLQGVSQEKLKADHTFDGISDDDISRLTIGHNESRLDYMRRVMTFADLIKADFQDKLRTSKKASETKTE